MTKDEIDTMWQQAILQSIEDDEVFTRYHFAKLVAAKAIKELESQEPVAWMDADGNVSDNNDLKCFPIPLYTHPPQRTWVDLTPKDLNEIFEFAMTGEGAVHLAIDKFKEKNT
jgi:hypothetical protein